LGFVFTLAFFIADVVNFVQPAPKDTQPDIEKLVSDFRAGAAKWSLTGARNDPGVENAELAAKKRKSNKKEEATVE
jgi:hypothetical protein